jgi:hypothetical protein
VDGEIVPNEADADEPAKLTDRFGTNSAKDTLEAMPESVIDTSGDTVPLVMASTKPDNGTSKLATTAPREQETDAPTRALSVLGLSDPKADDPAKPARVIDNVGDIEPDDDAADWPLSALS